MCNQRLAAMITKAEFSLGQGVPITFYRCRACHAVGVHKGNMAKHQQCSQACSGAGIDAMCRVVGDADVLPVDGLPAMPPSVAFESSVIPARTSHEMDAMVRALATNAAALQRVLSVEDLSQLFPIMLTFTKGKEGPPELRNVHMQGRYVYEKQVHGITKTPVKQYVCQLLPVFISGVLQRTLNYGDEDFFFKPPPGTEALYDRVFVQSHKGARRQAYTLSQAAQLYAKGAKDFHACAPDSHKRAIVGGIQAGLKVLKAWPPPPPPA